MKECSNINGFENGLSPVEDIRDKISFQLHELFSFYKESDDEDEDDIDTRII